MIRAAVTIRLWAHRLTERGATSVEYAIMVSLVAVIVIAGAVLVGSATSNNFNDVGSKMP